MHTRNIYFRGFFRIMAGALAGLCCATALFGRDWDRGGPPPPPEPPAPAAAVTVSGELTWVDGRIAVVAGQKTYYPAGIQSLIGFVEGLKEGAVVTLEGNAQAASGRDADVYRLWVTKLTFKGKEYLLNLEPAPGPGPGPGAGPGPRDRRR